VQQLDGSGTQLGGQGQIYIVSSSSSKRCSAIISSLLETSLPAGAAALPPAAAAAAAAAARRLCKNANCNCCCSADPRERSHKVPPYYCQCCQCFPVFILRRTQYSDGSRRAALPSITIDQDSAEEEEEEDGEEDGEVEREESTASIDLTVVHNVVRHATPSASAPSAAEAADIAWECVLREANGAAGCTRTSLSPPPASYPPPGCCFTHRESSTLSLLIPPRAHRVTKWAASTHTHVTASDVRRQSHASASDTTAHCTAACWMPAFSLVLPC
jgi:hypothetical protein